MAELTVEERLRRRAAREARRAKQRLENINRAKKMHEARSSGAYERQQPPAGAARNSLQQLNVGCSGWFYWHWKGSFYPQDLPSARWFDHYASVFRTVELNAPFYSWPTVSTVKTWIRQAGRRRFVYTVKVSELITHTKRFQGTPR
jgi:hypothetical protein